LEYVWGHNGVVNKNTTGLADIAYEMLLFTSYVAVELGVQELQNWEAK
jgi:hypothetical protein